MSEPDPAGETLPVGRQSNSNKRKEPAEAAPEAGFEEKPEASGDPRLSILHRLADASGPVSRIRLRNVEAEASPVRVPSRAPSEEELPARSEEVHHAKQEGIDFRLLTNPVEFLGREGRLVGVRCIRMDLGEPDESGRRRPVPVEGSEFEIEADTAIIAVGNGPHPLVPQTTPGLDLTRWGNIVADPETGQTSKAGVFAGGDIVTGAATVIQAMGAGKRAAAAIHEFITAA